MANQDDIQLIIRQEQQLAFTSFDEAVAFSLGNRVRERALAENLPIVCDIRTWDRQLFFMAMPGSSGDNTEWVRRKVNVTQRVLKSSYRVVLEKRFEGDFFPPGRGWDNADFALAGGCFPIRVKGAGPIGCITISGVHQRDDHGIGVAAVCEELGLVAADWALPKLV